MAHNTRSQKDKICLCGGGQSCIVDRRQVGDIVYEDVIFEKHNIPKRASCFVPFTKEQEEILKYEMNGYNSVCLESLPQTQDCSIYDRWNIDLEIENEAAMKEDYKQQTDYD